MKKALIITYYWPPSGGAGVQRWLKFAKYLRENGWEPVIYTVENGEYPVIDHSFEKDIPEGIVVIKRPIWEPYSLYKKITGQKKKDRVVSGFLQEKGKVNIGKRLSLWIRGNIFIPDARVFWVKPSIAFLNKYLKMNPVDVIISTGPPHSMHLIARGIKRKTGLKWLADFRDPWVNIDFAGDLPSSEFAKRKQIHLEESVLNEADEVIVVSNFMAEEFLSKTSTPITVITNGYDADDFKSEPSEVVDSFFRLTHTGSLNNRRNQPALWNAIAELCVENEQFRNDFRLCLIGKNDISVHQSIEEAGIQSCVEWVDYLPHEQIIGAQKIASVLLLSINNYGTETQGFYSPKATLTGKLFEYMAAGRPIFMIGPKDGQAARILLENSANRVVDFDDAAGCKQALLDLYTLKNNQVHFPPDERFSRRRLSQQLAAVLNRM